MQQGSRNQSSTVVGVVPMSNAPSGPSHQIEEYWTAAVKHKVRRIHLSSVYKVVRGQQTDVFIKTRSKAYRGLADLSFSLFYKSRNEERTLDLVCKDNDEFDLWYNGLRLITEHSRNEAMGGGEVLGFPDQMFGTPAPKKSPPGDCYIWGALPSQVQKGAVENAPVSSPQLVPASQKLDIVQVACGPQHYAAVTRSGHLYTWGTGESGRLGLGTLQHVATPTAVFGLDDMSGVKCASCGDCNTSAILTDGSICTWGGGLSGRLGHGNLATQYLPRKIEKGLQGVFVIEVSCGPYHTAAYSNNGQLYTWGDGLCGKLGHGNWESTLVPKLVEGLLSEGRVIAVVELGASPKNVSLYVWGGEFTWEGDHNKGCLGNGSTKGSTRPLRVEGDLGLRNVKQVACGLNLTVALSTDGLVYQMGATGAEAAHVEWEGARNPTRVEGRLKGHFADKVACGRQHVCVVATPIFGGKLDENRQSSYLFSWGNGKNGQLGNGNNKDQSSPHLVEALRQRRIEDISCGGDYTLAVCRYDPRVAAAAFVPHPEPAYSSSMNERTLRKSAAPGYTTSGAYTGPVSTVFGAFKQKSVKHRRNDGSNVGPEVQVPRPPPKVIGVYTSTRVRLERQKISEMPFFPQLATAPPQNTPTPSSIAEQDGSLREDDESSTSMDPNSTTMVTPRRDTAPAEYRGPFGGQDVGGNRRLHMNAETAYHPANGLQDSQLCQPGQNEDMGGSFEGSDIDESQVCEDCSKHSTINWMRRPCASDRARIPRAIPDQRLSASKDGRSSTEGSMTTTEGLGRSYADYSDDEAAAENRSLERSNSHVDLREMDEVPVDSNSASFDGDMIAMQRSQIENDSKSADMEYNPSNSQTIPRSQQLRSAARLRSRQKVLQQVLSLSESWTASEQQMHMDSMAGIGRDPTVVQSARAPRLWESDRHIIRENAIDDMGMEASRTYLGSKGAGLGNSARVTCDFDKKVHFEECQQVPTGSGSSTSQPMTVHVVDQSGDAYHPLPRQVLQLPGHSARYRPDVLPKLQLDRGESLPVGQSLPLATAREQVMSKAAECEHIRQELLKYAENLQSTQAKLNSAALEQGKDANRLGLDLSKIQETLKGSSTELIGGAALLEKSSLAKEHNSRAVVPDGSMSRVLDLVQRASALVARNPVREVDADRGISQPSKLLRENKEMKEVLASLSSLVGDLGATLKIRDAAPASVVNLRIPDSGDSMHPESGNAAAPPSSSNTGSKSVDVGGGPEEPGSETETQMTNMRLEHVDEGVSVIFQSIQNVTKIKKIRFSKRLFTAAQAQKWWEENQSRLVRDYSLAPGYILGDHNPVRSTEAELGDHGSREAVTWMGAVTIGADGHEREEANPVRSRPGLSRPQPMQLNRGLPQRQAKPQKEAADSKAR